MPVSARFALLTALLVVVWTHDVRADRKTVCTITVNSPDESAPPTTRPYDIKYASGTVDVTTGVQPTHRYDIYVSCATKGDPPLASSSMRVDLPPAG